MAVLGLLWASLALMLNMAHGSDPISVCQSLEREFGNVFQSYAKKHDAWPALSPHTGALQPDWTSFEVHYNSFELMRICPEDPNVDEKAVLEGRNPGSFYYLGYVVRNEKEWDAFAAAYRARIAEGGGFEDDLTIPGEYGGGVVRRLSPSAISELAEEPGGADIPVLFERPNNHVPKGMNVLYADGHVQFVEFGTKFPAIQATVDFIDALEGPDG